MTIFTGTNVLVGSGRDVAGRITTGVGRNTPPLMRVGFVVKGSVVGAPLVVSGVRVGKLVVVAAEVTA